MSSWRRRLAVGLAAAGLLTGIADVVAARASHWVDVGFVTYLIRMAAAALQIIPTFGLIVPSPRSRVTGVLYWMWVATSALIIALGLAALKL